MILAELNQQLKTELDEVQASLQGWQTQKAEALSVAREAQEKAAFAQRQIDVHQGHVERIGIWLAKLGAEQGADAPPAGDQTIDIAPDEA